MDCNDVRKKLSAYHDDELSFKERELLKKHLTFCLSCSEEEKRLIWVSSLIDEISPEDISLFFAERVITSVKADLKTRHERHFLKPVLAGFGIIMILLLGIIEFKPQKTIEATHYEYLKDFEDFPPDSFSNLYMSSIKEAVR